MKPQTLHLSIAAGVLAVCCLRLSISPELLEMPSHPASERPRVRRDAPAPARLDADLPSVATPAREPVAEAVVPTTTFGQLLEGAEEIARRDSAPDDKGRVRRERLVRAEKFKYPLIKVDEIWVPAAGGESVLQRHAVVADHVMVKLRDSANEASFLEMVDLAGLVVRKKFPASGLFLIAGDKTDLDTVERLIRDLGQVSVPLAGVEADPIVEALDAMPGNSRFGEQWALHNTGQSAGTADADIDAPEAWDIAKGNSNIVVGVIDTGIDYSHPNLASNIWRNAGEITGDGIDNDGNGYIDDVHGYDFYSDDGDPMDTDDHGTHVAGTIGGAAGPANTVAGVCWNVSLMGMRFLGPGGGTTSDAIDAVAYSVQSGVNLTSNSWGGGGFSSLLEAQILNAGDHDMLFVAAAGNSGVNSDATPHYPAAYNCPNIISVAATDRNDAMATFSNYGHTTVDIAAPGVSILSSVPGDGYSSFSGTSMACPHVSGACALLLGIDPGLSAADLKTKILASADSIPSQAGKSLTGGRLNLLKAALLANPAPYLTIAGPLISDPSGNNDGFANPNETVGLSITVANIGMVGVANVTATLSTTDPVATILGGTVQIGNLAGGGTATPSGGFSIRFGATPTPHVSDFTVTLRDGAGTSWSRPLKLAVSSTATISGYVRKAADPGLPVSTATVIFSGSIAGTVPVDANGYYRFTGIDGTYQLTASAPGYASDGPVTATVAPGITSVSRDFLLGTPDIQIPRTPLEFTLAPGGKTSGSLTLTNTGSSPLVHGLGDSLLVLRPDAGTLWHRSGLRTAPGLECWYYGSEATRTYQTGSRNSGSLAAGPFIVPVGSPVLAFDEWLQTEGDASYDQAWVAVSTDGGSSWTNLSQSSPTAGIWKHRSVSLAGYVGRTVLVRFSFDTIGSDHNDFEGWHVDRPRLGDTTWLETSSPGLPLAAGTSASVDFAIDAALLGVGIYQGRIEIASNDPDEPLVAIPVTLSVMVPGLTLSAPPPAARVQLPAQGTTFGPANPYPSAVTVSGVAGVLAGIRVKIDRFSHSWPSDLDLLLESPSGTKVLLMSRCGGSTAVSNVSLNFVHGVTAPVIGIPVTPGDHVPTSGSPRGSLPGAPARPYESSLDALIGSNPNGVWKLHGYDWASQDSGSIEGWSLEVMTVDGMDSFAPWAMAKFGYGHPAGTASGDPDQDGISNLLEYALGLNPNQADSQGLPVLGTVTTTNALGLPGGPPAVYLSHVVSRQSRRADLDYIVEISRDLLEWNQGAGHTVVVADTASRLEVRDVLPAAASARTFMRLRVDRR